VAFPVEQSAANTTQTSNDNQWGAQNMPSGIVAGETLVASLAVDGSNVIVFYTGGWTVLLNGSSGSDGSVTLSIAYKKAVGSDTLSIALDSNQQGSCRVWRINTAEDPDTQAPEIGAVTTGTSATPAVGLITPTGGAKDYKFYALCAQDRNRTFTSAPTNYQANDATLVSGGANGAQLSWGDRDVNASTQDPDNFTYTASDGFATVVLVIHPVDDSINPISAVLPGEFDVVADLKGGGLLSAVLPIEYAVLSSLLGDGKLDAALAIEVDVLANATGISGIFAALPIEVDVVADLKGGGPLTAVLPIEYNIAAPLLGDGKLDAAMDIVFDTTALLRGEGQLAAVLSAEFNVVANMASGIFAALPIEYNVTADLKADGRLIAVLPAEFNLIASLLGEGKLDAALDIVFGIVANLTSSQGGISAILPIEYSVAASLLGDGQLTSTPLIEFNLTGNLLSASAGSLSAALPMEFNVVSDLTNGSNPIYPFIDRRHIAAFIN